MWKPISTAPEDRPILVRSARGYVATAEKMLFGWALYRSSVPGDGDSFGGPYYLFDDWEPVEWSEQEDAADRA